MSTVSSSWAPEGKADKFDGIPANDLLGILVKSYRERGFGEGDDAETFARTLNGKFLILEGLALIEPSDPLFDPILDLLLSFPHEKYEDNVGEREIAQRIVQLAEGLPETALDNNARRLCYWIDATDAKISRLDNIEKLWLRLLPSAEKLANDKVGVEHYSSEF